MDKKEKKKKIKSKNSKANELYIILCKYICMYVYILKISCYNIK